MYAFKKSCNASAVPDEDFEDSAYAGSETMSVSAKSLSPSTPGRTGARSRRRSSGSAVETQLKYNHDRHEISRSIAEAIKVASAFKAQATNTEWPMQVPMVESVKRQRPGCPRSETIQAGNREQAFVGSPRAALKRSATTSPLDEEAQGPRAVEPESCVLSEEVNKQLQILRPEVMMAAHEENIIHTMNPKAVGEIMEQQFVKVQKHLTKLHVRVEDISSKVLVTGDLNAGKSTFCNALLRQRVLPTDQQPCTEVFCEVLDARENDDMNEVHAVSQDSTYDREDSKTFKRLRYEDLDAAVLLPSEYSSLKVYVDDNRPLAESLLRNGVVDISLIDAPGLNSDSVKTTAVYARQEEIDVIVFVVSAENHFTLSAKQFLWNAANEKAYLFIVVNRFDNIKDKDRCRRVILEQIAKLSPNTHADAQELVHFVSADGVLDDSTDSPNEAFVELELQLRNFVLNKRSQSKLAPAKNFVGKFWDDTKSISIYNHDIASEEQAKFQLELLESQTKLTSLSQESRAAIDQATSQNEATSEIVRNSTRSQIMQVTNALQDLVKDVPYPGVLESYGYACNLRDHFLKSILDATVESEMRCRDATSQGVDIIRNIGLAHLGPEQYSLKPFNAKFMFSRKRDAIQRNLPVELHPLDFVDFAKFEAVVGTSSLSAALLLYGGKTLGWSALVDTSFRVLNTVGIERTPKLIGGLAIVSLAGMCTYVIYQIPHALQKNLAKKVQDTVVQTDYAGNNANRIANDCRKILQIPEHELRVAFSSKVEAEQRAKVSIEKHLLTTTATIDFFRRQAQVVSREQRRLEKLSL